ncbi:uncharacterized protein B0H64DRAFT_472610 [Chaetomium fimeti]|uniref:AttH domain-containing protein n=1 Tax=Chaetomium fimeti TaxID=1854472 RepID=A0AAE0HNK7_9PEZI|nr:hypothetical protein B0H64DRAFT_472610 [Chaetomium fimeti]
MAAAPFTSLLQGDQFLADTPIPGTAVLPDSANLFPKWPEKLSPTAVETWLFDAMAEDGSAAFTVSFFRDGSQAPASFRAAINAAWADGTVWSQHLVVPVSVVTSEGPDVAHGRITGAWRTEESQDDNCRTSATFDVATDLSTTTVTFDAPGRITGNLTQRSLGYATLPKTDREAEVAPGAYWMRPIAMADATVDLTFHIDDPTNPDKKTEKRMLLGPKQRAFGGMDRSWLPMVWGKEATDALFVRAKAGPYVMAMMRLVSKAHKYYQTTVNAALYRDGKLVSYALRSLPPDRRDAVATADAVRTEKLHEGAGLPAKFRDKNVGYRLDFRSAGPERERWWFDLRHHQAWWAKPTSRPGPDGTGNSGFVVEVTGGLVGSNESVHGWGMSGEVELPD